MPSVNDMRISSAGQTTFAAPVPFPTPVAASPHVPVPVVPSSHSGPGVRTAGEPVTAEAEAPPTMQRPLMAAEHAEPPSEPPASNRMFSFHIQFAEGKPNQFLDVPEGWEVSEPASGVVKVTHTMGALPVLVNGFGLTDEADVWKQFTFSGGSLVVSYNASEPDAFSLSGVSTKAMFASGLRALIHVFF